MLPVPLISSVCRKQMNSLEKCFTVLSLILSLDVPLDTQAVLNVDRAALQETTVGVKWDELQYTFGHDIQYITTEKLWGGFVSCTIWRFSFWQSLYSVWLCSSTFDFSQRDIESHHNNNKSLGKCFLSTGNCYSCDQRGSEGCRSNGICLCKVSSVLQKSHFISHVHITSLDENTYAISHYALSHPDECGGPIMLQLQIRHLLPQPRQQRRLSAVFLHGSHSAVLQLLLLQKRGMACRQQGLSTMLV